MVNTQKSPDELPAIAHVPIDGPTMRDMLHEGFELQTVLDAATAQRLLIAKQTDQVNVVLVESNLPPISNSNVLQTNPIDVSELRAFRQGYRESADDPHTKIAFDTTVVRDFLSTLGATGILRDTQGKSAAPELQKLKGLLQADYEKLPDTTEKRPELRMQEAIVAEELALLWQPQDAGPWDNAIAIKTSLLTEAASLFRGVAASETAPFIVTLEAQNRAIDMELKLLALQAQQETDPRRQQSLQEQATTLSQEGLNSANAAWLDTTPRTQIKHRRGRLYEYIALAHIRNEAVRDDFVNRQVRMAMPREDRTHRGLPVILNPSNLRAMISVDIVEENAAGNITNRYQVKSITTDEQAARTPANDPILYRGGHHYPGINMVYLHEEWLPKP